MSFSGSTKRYAEVASPQTCADAVSSFAPKLTASEKRQLRENHGHQHQCDCNMATAHLSGVNSAPVGLVKIARALADFDGSRHSSEQDHRGEVVSYCRTAVAHW
jgi:hypothetical protein